MYKITTTDIERKLHWLQLTCAFDLVFALYA